MRTACALAAAVFCAVTLGCMATAGAVNRGDTLEPPKWYVKKETTSETYEASRRMLAESLKVTFGPWYYVGPFENQERRSFDVEFPPEKGVDLKATYRGKKGETVAWKRGDLFRDGQVNDLHLFRDGDNFVVYLYRTITAPKATALPVFLGSDDTLTVWLNGKKLLANNSNRSCTLGDDQLTLALHEGENQLLLKVCQSNGGTAFAFDVSRGAGSQEDRLFQCISRDFPQEAESFWAAMSLRAEPDRQFEQLRREMQKIGWFKGMAQHALRSEALILESDRDPLEIALRRTEALLKYLQKTSAAAKLGPLEVKLRQISSRAAATDVKDSAGREGLYQEVCKVRRKIAFANPLLNFDKILFVKRQFLPPEEGRGNHMCDQYFGFHAIAGGGVYVLDNPFGDAPKCRDLVAGATCGNGRFEGKRLDSGAFLSPSLSYDGRTILFAYTEADPTRYKWTEKSTWHIFKMQTDGSNLTQLTDGPTNDFDPCYLPNGRIVFISERRGGFGRCHGRPVPTYTLHTMNDDGSDITCISYHETNEWHPSVNKDGMIVYTRWDYVDRGHGQAHHPWITTPDGRDARAIQGNYGRSGARPNMEMQVRAIPGSGKYVATAAAHHGQAYGSLVVLDPLVPDDDGMAPLKMLTPEVGFPEATGEGRQVYASAWPLSEDFFLCVYDGEGEVRRGGRNRYGIYLVDSFGNKELLYRGADNSCLSPMPLRPQTAPPIVPPATKVGLARTSTAVKPQASTAARANGEPPETGTVGVLNVYSSFRPWPEGTQIKSLRIVQVLPKTTPGADNPRIGYGRQKNARQVLGSVPVEADGSAYFRMPVGKPVFFQALDEKGMAVQSMRSDTYIHPGETLQCQGCHEPTRRAAAAEKSYRNAFRRAPSTIVPDVEGSRPLSYPRLVQPVLDRCCVDCHAKSGSKTFDLGKGNWEKNPSFWYTSYMNLKPYAYFIEPEGWTEPNTIPGKFGARASRLYQILEKGHYGVKLSPDDMHRLTLWLDCNSDFFGAYDQTKEQAEGKVVQPAIE